MVVAVIVLLIVRQRFVPASFGEEGHYRADVVPLIASQPIEYAGLQACADCHPDEVELKASSFHRGLACEGCHGAAADHVDDPTEVLPLVPTERGICLRCHIYLPSRPTGFPQVIESLHNPSETTARPRTPERAEGRRIVG